MSDLAFILVVVALVGILAFAVRLLWRLHK